MTTRRIPWTRQEDEALINWHRRLGPLWTKISSKIVSRTPRQCADRWYNSLRPGSK
ncbi:10087_t:CDS:2 [Paraglomus occultum]|uniref:10087_t:CDS:1 n=1 Tax=Paraglomus occultum TaxID=144539 RepID=A0A9N9B8I8_9GLOM|nr:10087_t:CDS:2 [Paraglomus occultum]